MLLARTQSDTSQSISAFQDQGGSAGDMMYRRLLWIDMARTAALLGMIVFHFVRDLEMFAVIEPGATTHGAWAVFARLVAGAFLFISGVSFVLAHQSGFRPRAWAKRLMTVGGAAALVTLATLVMFPDRFIYFGILHAITAASIVAGALLALPAWGVLLLASLVAAVGALEPSSLFTSPMLAWTGLTSTYRPSLDFVPLVPWLSAFLAGMAFAKALPVRGLVVPHRFQRVALALAWPGQHSLAIYLLHQPILLAAIWLALAIA